ncbi:DUF3153 domain-containing protein [Gordonia sp. CPCC 205515]|uniref:LppM family (lipo)protein n=1 Tax=Gordonia sp. CPCC 205515 TaxID=3140791 RepID=UPI003AF36346
MSSVRSSSRWSAILMLLCLVGAVPLLSGCLQRSTSVGDRYSGTVVVATSPDNPRGAPQLDIPESMSSRVTVSEYSTGLTSGTVAAPAPSAAPGEPEPTPPRVGTQASFSELTAGQFSQLGDIIADSFGDSAMSMTLTSKRSGDVVRFHGTADLGELDPNRDLVELTVTFDGPVTAAPEKSQTGDKTVSWTPAPGQSGRFVAEAKYADPATAAVGSWSWFVALLCLITVAIVARLAYVKRDRSPRPGRPKYSTKPDETTDSSGNPDDTTPTEKTPSKTSTS